MRRKIVFASTLLLLALPLQAEEPPMTLPKDFLAQLPLLMSLSDQEFESFLITTQQKDETSGTAKNGDKEKKDDEN